jgi:hypothetical protein
MGNPSTHFDAGACDNVFGEPLRQALMLLPLPLPLPAKFEEFLYGGSMVRKRVVVSVSPDAL